MRQELSDSGRKGDSKNNPGKDRKIKKNKNEEGNNEKTGL